MAAAPPTKREAAQLRRRGPHASGQAAASLPRRGDGLAGPWAGRQAYIEMIRRWLACLFPPARFAIDRRNFLASAATTTDTVSIVYGGLPPNQSINRGRGKGRQRPSGHKQERRRQVYACANEHVRPVPRAASEGVQEGALREQRLSIRASDSAAVSDDTGGRLDTWTHSPPNPARFVRSIDRSIGRSELIMIDRTHTRTTDRPIPSRHHVTASRSMA